MPVPVAFPLASFLARAGITALGTGAATEGIKSLQNQGVVNPNMAQQALMRTIMGPTSEIFNRTTDTPSGKVFAPTGEVIEPNQIPGIAPPEQQQGITGLPIPEQQQGITGLPIPEKAPGLPGLINPEQVDTSILNKEETPEQPVKPEETKNQIKTWEIGNFKNIEEAKQKAEKVGIPFNELELGAIKQQITFKKDYAGYDAYFNGKLIGRMDDITQGLKDDNPEIYKGNQKTFNLSFLDSSGYMDAVTDTVDTIAEAKYMMKQLLAKDLLDKESLTRRNFENQKYDKKGNPIVEEYKIETKDLGDMSPLEQEAVKQTLNRTSNPSGSLTEVSTNPSEPFDNTDTSAVDFFPFNPIDFKKNGILNNPEIVKAFDDLKNDVKIKPPVGFNEDYMALQQSDSFYLTPPRAQMEITLKYLEKQLEENKASEETLNLIKNLNKDLQAKIKDTGYYAENKKVEDRITNLPGMTNKLKKLKSSN
jgi:hypothetical protein